MPSGSRWRAFHEKSLIFHRNLRHLAFSPLNNPLYCRSAESRCAQNSSQEHIQNPRIDNIRCFLTRCAQDCSHTHIQNPRIDNIRVYLEAKFNNTYRTNEKPMIWELWSSCELSGALVSSQDLSGALVSSSRALSGALSPRSSRELSGALRSSCELSGALVSSPELS